MISLIAALALPSALAETQAVPVRLVQNADGYQLQRGGKPYLIRGAGIHNPYLEAYVRIGGNSIRTWGADNLEQLLDDANRLGVTVTVGYWMGHRGQGFDYRNAEQVKKQFDGALASFRKYKNHPAVLAWAVGNEMELGEEGPEVYKAIEDIAKAIKREDPNHPVMTVVADMWPQKMAMLNQHCPSLDLLGVNSYGGLPTLATRMADWKRPYVVTEWDYPGAGSFGETPWKTPLEPTSTEKAKLTAEYAEKYVYGAPGRVLGGYYFHFSPAEAATVGWNNAFLKTGEKLAMVDVLQRQFTGKEPKNRAPSIVSIDAPTTPTLAPGAKLAVRISAFDPDRDKLTYAYEIVGDDPKKRFVGDFERDAGFAGSGEASPDFSVSAPKEPGPYRLVIVVRDGKGSAAAGSVSFQVRA